MVCQDCDGKLRQLTDEPCSTFPEDSLFRSWLIDYTPAIRGGVANTVISMTAKYAEAEPAERVVGRFLREYHKIWQSCFPGLMPVGPSDEARKAALPDLVIFAQKTANDPLRRFGFGIFRRHRNHRVCNPAADRRSVID